MTTHPGVRELRAKVKGLLLVVLIGGVEHPQRLKICTLEHGGLFIVLHREECVCVCLCEPVLHL